MIINQKLYSKGIFLVFYLFISISVTGQVKMNYIENIFNEDSLRHPGSIKISLKTDQSIQYLEVKKGDSIHSDGEIEIIKEEDEKHHYTLHLKTINGTEVIIPPGTIVRTKVTKDEENYNLLKIPSNKKLRINKLKTYLGNVLTDGIKRRIEALTVGTEFSLGLVDNDLEIKLFDGKLKIKHLIKKEIEDDNVIGNNGKRSIFVRKDNIFTDKNKIYSSPINNSVLTNDKEIKKYLRQPFKNQRKLVISSGENAKEAFKYVANQDSTELALLSFEKAVDNGELKIDLIIQSAFLFADYYLFSDNPEKSKNWLDLGLHFSKDFYEIKFGKKFYNPDEEFLNINISDSNYAIDKVLKKELRYEMLNAYEFITWGYDIKLKLNGCLESSDENPVKFRTYANNLITAIEKDN